MIAPTTIPPLTDFMSVTGRDPMTEPTPTSAFPSAGALRRIRFVPFAGNLQTSFMTFADPAPCQAVISADAADIEILCVPSPPKDSPILREELTKWVSDDGGDIPPITTTIHGAQIFWRPGRAAIVAAADRIEPLVLAVVEFSHFECELSKLEAEIAAAWPDLAADTPLAYDVTVRDLERHEEVGRRMGRTLERRMRHARIEPHLYRTPGKLPALAQELGERLREKCQIEDRLEALDGHLEVFEYTYELSSQRIAEFRAARKEHTLEWIIIVLLAVETTLLLVDLLWQFET